MENKKYYVYLAIKGEDGVHRKIIRYNYREEKYHLILTELSEFTIREGPILDFIVSFEEENHG